MFLFDRLMAPDENLGWASLVKDMKFTFLVGEPRKYHVGM
jgi:hypothetical protein